MQLLEAFQLISQTDDGPKDAKGLMVKLHDIAENSLEAILDGNYEKAKIELEDALFCLFLAYKQLGLNPEKTISRQLAQNKRKKKDQKVMLIKSNKVEIIVDGVSKGNWFIWDNQDVEDAKKIARDFGIRVIQEKPCI